MNTPCFLWKGLVDKKGYGRTRHDGRMRFAHRVAWTVNVGPIPKSLFVCHRCDTPACMRIDHLFLGTNKHNLDDMTRKGRKRTRIPGKSYDYTRPDRTAYWEQSRKNKEKS